MIYLFNPYKKAGGGQRIQNALIEIINEASGQRVVVFTSLRSGIGFILAAKQADFFIIQSIYAWRSLIILLCFFILQLAKPVCSLVIIPRGDRIPARLLDKQVKASIKKFLYSKIFLALSKRYLFIYSSISEEKHYSKFRQIDSSFVIPDPNFYIAEYLKLPKRIKVDKFLFLGRNAYEKNIDFLISIFKEKFFVEEKIKLDIYLIAAPNEFNKLEFSLRNYDNINLKPALENTNKIFKALKSSVALNPSLYESFGLVPLEAINAGASFISTPVGVWTKSSTAGKIVELSKKKWIIEILQYYENGILNDYDDRNKLLLPFTKERNIDMWKKVIGDNELK